MKSSTEERFHKRGWCPRVWTPMESGDGFIVRVHPGWRPRSAGEVRALAALARDYGSGQMEVTRRANWQLRGVTLAALPALQAAIASLGLADPAGAPEAAASLLVDPMSGLDPACARLESVAELIERALASAQAPRDLPSKFGIVLDGGSDIVAGVLADIRVELRSSDRDVAQIYVDDSLGGGLLLGACDPGDVVAAVLALMQLASNGAGAPQRMRDVIAARGIELVRGAVAQFLRADAGAPRASSAVPSFLGFRRGVRNWIGLGLPFGSGDVRQWAAIADIAEQFGDGTLRLTPRRTVIVAGVGEECAEAAIAAARRGDLVVEPRDARLRMTACIGAPACSAARGETRRFASEVARDIEPLLAAGGMLHVSGCPKSCAHSGIATLTVVCDERGYRIARDRDVAGACEADVLPVETARRLLAAMALAPGPARPRS